jgi:hypothetical protein
MVFIVLLLSVKRSYTFVYPRGEIFFIYENSYPSYGCKYNSFLLYVYWNWTAIIIIKYAIWVESTFVCFPNSILWLMLRSILLLNL